MIAIVVSVAADAAAGSRRWPGALRLPGP